ncbi:MAG: hypothetical protein AAGA12_11480 [Pseudomonadota bacterium]
MNQNSGGLTCVIGCLLIAGLGGVLIGAMLWLLADFAIAGAVFFGLVAAVIAWACLSWAFCRGLPGPNEAVIEAKVPGAATSTKPLAAAPASVASAAASVAAATPAPEPAAKPKPAAKKPAARKTEAKTSPAPKTAAKKPVAKDGKPDLLDKPRGGTGDDLKQIKGVGPKLEGTLNEMGVWHFDQIAGWRKKEIEWVDDRLKFKGRIERDGWIDQAKTLAKGEATEFSSRVKKGDVY